MGTKIKAYRLLTKVNFLLKSSVLKVYNMRLLVLMPDTTSNGNVWIEIKWDVFEERWSLYVLDKKTDDFLKDFGNHVKSK